MAKAILVAAPSSGSGKTLVTLGLLRAFRNRGMRVASAKAGPDYIDPRFHEAATGKPCFNLDPWAMTPEQLRGLAAEIARGADLLIIEGVMGLFDGPQGGGGSTAELAALLGLPVLLTIDCRHQAQSAAALLHGFSTYRKDVTVAGVVLNRVASERHEKLLRNAIGDRVAAVLRHDDTLKWPSRHLGLVQAEENAELEAFIAGAAARIGTASVLARVLEAAKPLADASPAPPLAPLGPSVAVARDAAFSFSYPHLLEGWRKQGAALSFFSPLADEPPDPKAAAVFLPGGYPELNAGKLSGNNRFLAGLRSHPGLVYGECGGYMVLGETLTDARGVIHPMARMLPLSTSFATRKLNLGYRRLTPLQGVPWATRLAGHEFHYSTVISEGEADRLFAAEDSAGATLPPMGLRRGRVMGSYAHVISGASA